MGYYTNFYGTIKLNDENADKSIIEDMGNLINNYGEGGLELDEETNSVSVWGDIKNYENEIELTIKKILNVYPKATGEVICRGEELEDVWGLRLKGNGSYNLLKLEMVELE